MTKRKAPGAGRRPRRPDAHELAGELREDDGVDPRYERRGGRTPGVPVADLRLASQIRDALTLALSEAGDAAVAELRVDAVMRVGRGNTYVVRLAPESGSAGVDLESAQAGIDALAGHLRAEVSQAISRRFSPYLRFAVVPAGGWEADEDSPLAGHAGAGAPLAVSDDHAADAEPAGPVAELASAALDPGASSAPVSLASRLHEDGCVPLLVWSPERRLAQGLEDNLRRLVSAPDVRHVAVMPDIHRGKSIPNGVVLATRHLLYPEAVGADMGCGVLAARLELDRAAFADVRIAQRVLEEIMRAVPVLKRTRHHAEVAYPAELSSAPLSDAALEKEKQRGGLLQLGTLGRGNHFVELQAEATGETWIMIHTGSRGIGQTIFARHAAAAQGEHEGLFYLDAETPAGGAYLADVDWATRYASANRRAILAACDKVLRDLLGRGADQACVLDAPHNFLRAERHFGEHVWVHRKSALSAALGEESLVPGSMAGPSFHVLGRGSPEALHSCAHGAGRRLSRTEAHATISPATLRRQMGKVVFNRAAETALVDEAPGAYKNPREVMRAQRDLAKTIRTLEPLVNYKAP